jgi:hypothetical protein
VKNVKIIIDGKKGKLPTKQFFPKQLPVHVISELAENFEAHLRVSKLNLKKNPIRVVIFFEKCGVFKITSEQIKQIGDDHGMIIITNLLHCEYQIFAGYMV